MKYLVSTKETQGQRKNDFCFVPEGELVRFGSECDCEDIDGRCGCRRSMIGMDCGTATTTMKVVELDMSEIELKTKLTASMSKSGFSVHEDDIIEEINEISRIAGLFQIGDILEMRGNLVQTRDAR